MVKQLKREMGSLKRDNHTLKPRTQVYDNAYCMHKDEIAQSRAKHFKLEQQNQATRKGSVNIGVKGANMFAIATCYNKKDVIRARQKEMREIALARKLAKNG
tara:strand:- start:7 stop:312 length:306 start_codon:yes stop_codon:yes gene_type:complete